MRHIPLRLQQPPDAAWVAKAELLLLALKAEPNITARNKIIDDNSAVWGELKQWLLSLSNQKCWFSEAKDCFSHWDVEHFRPKKSAKDEDGTMHDGYWWLAFNWLNFRICGNAGNRKKGTFFPLRSGNQRANNDSFDLRLEDPLLLDPVDEDDPSLLSFNFDGRAIAAPGLTDAWDKKRVEYSVERFNLDFPPLVDKRKVIWNECWDRIKTYREELQRYTDSNGQNPIARNQYKESTKALREMIKPDKELSSVARACIMSTGDPRVKGILQSC